MRVTETAEINRILGGSLIAGTGKEKINAVCQDSRLAGKGSAFFAVKGANFDGHDYLASAWEKGVSLFVIENREKFDEFTEKTDDFDGSCILVENTIDALVKLADSYLKSLDIKKTGVTGSCGKTSTRDMVYYVFSEKYKAHRNKGNFNTLVGVALTILDMPEDTEAAVFEMGMDGAGQIREIAELVKPDTAVITNVGVSHLENFENRDGIFNAKMEITEFFKGDETLIVSGDDDYLNHEKINKDFKVLVSGIKGEREDLDILIENVEEKPDMTVSFDITAEGESCHVELPVPGKHNARNAALALAAGKHIGISLQEGAEGLAKMNLTGKRLLVEEGRGVKVINDTYNANPLSMKAALDILATAEGIEGGRKIAVLGDMYELGPDEIRYHREVGEYAKKKADVVYSIGEMSAVMNSDMHFATKEEFLEKKKQLIKKGDMILIKASNGMKLDRVAEGLLSEEF